MAKKTFNTVNEVREARVAGQGIVMNMVAALEALKSTPATAARNVAPRDSEFKNDVRALFVEAKNAGVDALRPIQVAAMYRAAKGMDEIADDKERAKFNKKFYEHCLANSDHPAKNCKNPTYHYNSDAKVFSLLG